MPRANNPRFLELDFLVELEEACSDVESLADRALDGLARLVGCDFSTLSACELRRGHRTVVRACPEPIDEHRLLAFDRHFFEFPLVRAQGLQRRRDVQRISDVVDARQFRRSGLFDEYYRPLRIRHVLAIPLEHSDDVVTSIVLNRSGRDFTALDVLRLQRLRPHLAFLLRHARQGTGRAIRDEAQRRPTHANDVAGVPAPLQSVTPREAQVLGWLGAGKSNADIAAILGISARTVDKHLANAYPKLGVETRTGAVVRALELGLVPLRARSDRSFPARR